MPFRRTHRWRCMASFPCTPPGRHWYEKVAIDAVDEPGRCNDDADGENPNFEPDDSGQPLYDEAVRGVRTWFCFWIFASILVACLDLRQSEIEGDDRPWWGLALFALIMGGIFALVPGIIALIVGAR